MAKSKKPQSGDSASYLAAFIPTCGEYHIFFPDFPDALTTVKTPDECSAAAHQQLANLLLSRLFVNQGFPVPSDEAGATKSTISYLRAKNLRLDDNAPLTAIPYDREALDQIAAQVQAFRASIPGGLEGAQKWKLTLLP